MTAILADLLAAIGNGPNLERGLCVGHPDLWDAVDDPGLADHAAALCLECPVLIDCREWSSELSNRQLSGVVAGVVRPWDPRSTRAKAAS